MKLPESISELTPGDSVLLEDLSQLPTFEDLLAAEFEPDVTLKMREAWMGRVAIGELIRPPKFHGRISDIHLTVMEEPFDRLYDAVERGLSFGKNHPNSRTRGSRSSESIIGFILTTNARSSGRGLIGQIQSELWYSRVPIRKPASTRYVVKSGEVRTKIYNSSGKDVSSNGGSNIRRYVTKPKIESIDSFKHLDETAKTIGFEILRTNMLRPITQPMHN